MITGIYEVLDDYDFPRHLVPGPPQVSERKPRSPVAQSSARHTSAICGVAASGSARLFMAPMDRPHISVVYVIFED